MSQRANLIKCAGLITKGSELSMKEGALRRATNVNIDEDGVITPRRGFSDYGNPTDEFTSKPIKQLMEYKERLFRHFEDQIQFEDANGDFKSIAGSYTEVRSGYRIKSVESKGNLYFTTEEGIKRISVANQSDLYNSNVTIEQAGVPKAAYMEGVPENTVGGFLPAQSKVAYRFLFGRKDANNNLLLGSPSAREVITNSEDREVTYETIEITFDRSSVTDTYNEDTIYNADDFVKHQDLVYKAKDATTGIGDGTEDPSGDTTDNDYWFYYDIEDKDYFVLHTIDYSYTFYFKTTVAEKDPTPPYKSDTFGTTFVMVDLTNSKTDEDRAAVLANYISANLSQFDVSLSANTVTLTSNEEGDLKTPSSFFENFDEIIYPDYNIMTVESTQQGEVVEGESANCKLTIFIPADIDENYFIQVYRTNIITAIEGLDLNDIDPGDECNIVREISVTEKIKTAGFVEIIDTTPESFRASGTPLYTNQITGEGILQSNDPPPIALDIELFRNSMFYANTKTAHRLEFDIISVDNFEAGLTRFIIGNSSITRYYTADDAVTGTTDEGGTFKISDSLSVSQAIDETARNLIKAINQDLESPVNAYYLTGADDVAGQILLEARDLSDDTLYISIESGYEDFVAGTVYDDLAAVKYQTLDYIHKEIPKFLNTPWDGDTTYQVDDIVSVAITDGGTTTYTLWKSLQDDNSSQPPEEGSEFWIKHKNELQSYSKGNIVRYGNPPDNLLYKCISETTITGVLLTDTDNWESYTPIPPSGDKTSNELWDYINIGEEFNPELPTSRVMERLYGYTTSDGDFAAIQLTNHGLSVGDEIFVSFLSDGDINAPDSFSGVYLVGIIDDDPDNFYINYNLSSSFDSSSISNPFLVDDSAIFFPDLESDNLEVPNRLYYSKLSEPEAVPIANYIDIGAKDQEIKRILALRDNLFVLKDDGIYIVSGTSAPDFSVRLLDNARILAPDSAVVLNNQIFCLTEQGITVITDSGAGIISRGIENLIDKVTNSKFDYVSNTFGVAYENDRAYLLFMPQSSDDNSATQAFRYHIFERTWSRWEYNANCGLVAEKDNTLYLGSGDRNYVSKERKNFDRTDHSDRDFSNEIVSDGVNSTEITIASSNGIEVGDVIIQTQDISINYFNNRILRRMDTFDTGIIAPVDSTLLESFGMVNGDNLVEKLQALVDYLYTLDSSITKSEVSNNTVLDDMKLLVDELNTTGTITTLKNYAYPDQVIYEAYITSVDAPNNLITINTERPFIEGSIQVYKNIKKTIEWNPQHFGDPSALKQVREVTIMFDQNNFYDAIAKFGSDVDQSLTEVSFQGKGIGYWGDMEWSNPNAYWGGEGNDIPFRTIVPRSKQRCRYITMVFEHTNAREQFRLLGVSGVVRPISSRGYK
jgi:hypothetical protein